MNLRYVSHKELGKDISKLQNLFESAFPPEERPPFSLMTQWENHKFLGIYKEDRFVGLVDFIVYQDLVYVFFFAIEPPFRNQGIGAEVLKDATKKYEGKRIFLLMDEVEESYADYELRKRRLGFYSRNGFHYSGYKVQELGVTYQLMVYGSVDVTPKEFRSVMESLIGKEMADRYYGHL